MFLLVAVPIGVIAGLCRGGRLSRLSELRLRRWQFALIGLLIQVPIFSQWVAHAPWLVRYGTALYLLSFILLFVTLVSNWRLFGVPVLALGAALNFLAIIANGGRMPVFAEQLLETLGQQTANQVASGQVLTNVALAGQHTRLDFLGDVIPLPSFFPFANVYSIGDVLIAFGAVLILYAAMHSPESEAVPKPSQDFAGARRDA